MKIAEKLSELECQKCDVSFKILPGADINRLTRKGLDYVEQHVNRVEYDLIYLLVGVNELSFKNRFCKIRPKFTSSRCLIRNIMLKLLKAKSEFEKYAKKVVLCEMVGLSFYMWNRGGG